MSELQQFGGDWTIEKLDILTGYLDAYLTALKNFHFKMWLYVNGIANLVANNTCEFNDGQIQKLLEDQYISMLLFEVQKGNIGKEVLENMINNKLKYKDN